MGSFFLSLLIGFITLVEGTQIENARAIVTGGANGIGYHCAYDLLSRGAQAVAILDIDVVNGTAATQRLIDEFGDDSVFFFPTDVSNPFEFEMNFYSSVQTLGGLDIMINDAGFANDIRWSEMIDTDIKGVIQGTLMSFDLMGKHKGGRGGTVINMASIASLGVDLYTPGYDSAKYGVLGFSRSIALSYNITGVAVKAMCPGGTNTFLITDKSHRFFEFYNYDDVIKVLEAMPLQEPGRVSQAIMRLIEEAPNGAMWVVEPNEPIISLDIPNYREWGTPV